MPLPMPPTDNLYKFIAISGIIVLFLSIGYPILRNHELRLAALDVCDQEVEIFKMEDEYLFKESEQLNREIDSKVSKLHDLALEVQKLPKKEYRSLAQQQIALRITEEVQTYSTEMDSFAVQARVGEEKANNLKEKRVQLKTKLKRLNVELNYLKWMKILLPIGSAFGLVMLVFGFWAWYKKLQKWLDLKCMTEAHERGLLSSDETSE